MTSVVDPNRRRHVGLVHAVADADAQSWRVAAPNASGNHCGAVGSCQDVPRFIEKQAPCLGEFHPAFGPAQQRGLELRLQLPNLMAQGRLRDLQPAGGLAEVQ
jgi:hypothetical protein